MCREGRAPPPLTLQRAVWSLEHHTGGRGSPGERKRRAARSIMRSVPHPVVNIGQSGPPRFGGGAVWSIGEEGGGHRWEAGGSSPAPGSVAETAPGFHGNEGWSRGGDLWDSEGYPCVLRQLFLKLPPSEKNCSYPSEKKKAVRRGRGGGGVEDVGTYPFPPSLIRFPSYSTPHNVWYAPFIVWATRGAIFFLRTEAQPR